jgi:AcrR family transcriptional regulator
MTVAAAPRPYLAADRRKALIVEAVVALAARREPAAITTAAIAQEMALTQGAVFRHFASKEEIWAAAVDWTAETLLARLDAAAQAAPSPLAALEAMFLAHAGFAADHPGVPRLIFAELQKPEATPAREAARGLLESYAARVAARIEAAKAAGQASAGVETRAAALLFVGAVQGLVMQSLLTGDPARLRGAAPGVFAVFRRALAAPLPPAQDD